MRIRDTWVVLVDREDNDTDAYGPYTERQARHVARLLEEEAALAKDAYGVTHHPIDVIGANPYPLMRYEAFLTGEQRREVRREVKAASRRETEE